MASGDLYKLTLRGIVANSNQKTLNIFHYLQTTGGGGANDLGTAFYGDVLPSIRAICHQNQSFVQILTEDMADPTDFDSINFGLAGQVAGEQMPTQDALSFTYVSNRNDARSGGKRFGVYSEALQNGGVKQGSASALIAALETELESNLTDLSSNAWRPVIYGKRLPLGSTTYYSNPISGVQWFGFTTQNNRKFYTGPGY